jgi:hypothetical protein
VQIITALTAANTITFAATTFAPEFCNKNPPQIQAGARVAEFLIFARALQRSTHTALLLARACLV